MMLPSLSLLAMEFHLRFFLYQAAFHSFSLNELICVAYFVIFHFCDYAYFVWVFQSMDFSTQPFFALLFPYATFEYGADLIFSNGSECPIRFTSLGDVSLPLHFPYILSIRPAQHETFMNNLYIGINFTENSFQFLCSCQCSHENILGKNNKSVLWRNASMHPNRKLSLFFPKRMKTSQKMCITYGFYVFFGRHLHE